MPHATCQMALKEWAVAVRALDAGRQVILLRKGGIREAGKEFRVMHQEFFLYPTFEHQKEEMLKEAYHPDLRATLAHGKDGATVTLTHWAQVREVFEVTDQALLDRLSPYHIWSDDYAQKRLHWKPRKPLAVMAVRIFRLGRPQTIPVLPQYLGCTSWVELDREVVVEGLTPVLPDDVFSQRVQDVRHALAAGGGSKSIAPTHLTEAL